MEKLSTSDKWTLLGALYKHGSNEDKLANTLEEWDQKQIVKAVRSYRLRAKRSLESTEHKESEEPIDLWYTFINNCHRIEGTSVNPARKRRKFDTDPVSYAYLLEKSMLYASCFEEHYQGRNPDDPNYNEIYKYLAQLLAGEEPTQLRPGNAKKIVEMMSKLKNLLNDKESVQRYMNYVTQQHSVSYVKPGVDIESIIEEKMNSTPEIDMSEAYRLFHDADGPSSDLKLSALSENDPQYLVKKNKITLKVSLKQRALAGTIGNIPGMNPLEMVLASLVKPPITLQPEKLTNIGNTKSKSKSVATSVII